MIKKKCHFLVCTVKLDPHTDAIIDILEKRGKSVFRLNTEDFYQKYVFTLIQNKDNNYIKIENKVNGKYIESGEYKIPAYYRKPADVAPHKDCQDNTSRDISTKEANSFMKMLYASSLFHWTNDKFSNIKASRKNLQLEVATEQGLNFPDTLITTSKEDALQFFEKYHFKVILKPLNVSTYTNETDFFSVFAEIVEKEVLLANLESIELAPIFIQEYIQKKYELRICVFDRKVFACKIDSQQNENTIIDWRVINPMEIGHKMIQIPKWLEVKLITFNKTLGLEFGIYDFILTPQEEYYFLENNPNGQWYWIEMITKVKMAEAMANILEKHYLQQRTEIKNNSFLH
jgi:glutathione synthase/RimK-type ligase-like ATP-grasp enzyme